jgi:pyruvate formate lyase activating enzyme
VRHRRYIGASNTRIHANLRLLAESGADVWIRTPLLPGINDDRANLGALAELVGSLERTYPIFLLPYHRLGADKYRRLGEGYRLKDLVPPSRARLTEAAAFLRELDLDVRVGRSRNGVPSARTLYEES